MELSLRFSSSSFIFLNCFKWKIHKKKADDKILFFWIVFYAYQHEYKHHNEFMVETTVIAPIIIPIGPELKYATFPRAAAAALPAKPDVAV